MYRHHRVACIVYLLALGIIHMLYCEFHGRGIRREQLQLVSAVEFIPLAEHGVPVRVAGLDHGSDIRIRKVGRVMVILPRVAEIEAGRIRPVANLVHLFDPQRVKRRTGDGGVYRVAVGVRDDGGVVGRFHASLYLESLRR